MVLRDVFVADRLRAVRGGAQDGGGESDGLQAGDIFLHVASNVNKVRYCLRGGAHVHPAAGGIRGRDGAVVAQQRQREQQLLQAFNAKTAPFRFTLRQRPLSPFLFCLVRFWNYGQEKKRVAPFVLF